MVVPGKRTRPARNDETLPVHDREKFRARLKIDRDAIDAEVAEHAELFEHVAVAHVFAIAEHDALKQELDEAVVIADAEARVSFENSDKKPTETAIKRLVSQAREVQDLNRELLAAKLRVDQWAVLKESFGQRSYMLRELSGMYIARRYSTVAHVAREDRQEGVERRIQDERARRYKARG